jgi:hypothetical protein
MASNDRTTDGEDEDLADEPTPNDDEDAEGIEDEPYPLALGMNGEPIDVPKDAVGWRVSWRKHNERGGSPSLVYFKGRPLILALTATADDVVAAVSGRPGRYRLDPVDRFQRLIKDATPAYSVIEEAFKPAAAVASSPPPSDDPILRRFDDMMARVDRTVQTLENAFTVQSQQIALVLQACAQNVAPASRVIREQEQVTVQAPAEEKRSGFNFTEAIQAGMAALPLLKQLFPVPAAPQSPPTSPNGAGPTGNPNGNGGT